MVDLGWYAVYTGVRSERRACGSIEGVGFRVFCPEELVWVSHARRRRRVKRPLLSRYVFVRFDLGDEGWPRILRCEGVEAIMSAVTRNSEGDIFRFPVRVPEDQMARIIDWEAHPDIVEACRAGDIMRVIAGPLAGHLATITAVRAEKYRAVGDVEIFGAKSPVDFSIDDLERA